MIRARSALAPILALLATGCVTSTCDCIAPVAFVHGNVTGTVAPVIIEARLAPGDCSDESVLSRNVTHGRADSRGGYELALYPVGTGPTCLIMTALTLDLPAAGVTRRVTVTLDSSDFGTPQRIRVDLAFGTASAAE